MMIKEPGINQISCAEANSEKCFRLFSKENSLDLLGPPTANSLTTTMFTQGYLETVLFILVVNNSLLSKLAKFSCKPAIEKFFTRKLYHNKDL